MPVKRKLTPVQAVDKVILEFAKLGEDGWVKGADAVNNIGKNVSPLSKEACKFCNEGVLLKVLKSNNHNNTFRTINAAFEDVHFLGMVWINDRENQTFANNLFDWVKVRKYLAELEKRK